MKSEKDSLLLIFHKHSDTIIIRKHYFAESYSLLGIQEVDNCSKKNVAQFTEVTTSSWWVVARQSLSCSYITVMMARSVGAITPNNSMSPISDIPTLTLGIILCRVGQGHYCPFPPSEPYVKVSNHTAQAVLNFYLIETSS